MPDKAGAVFVGERDGRMPTQFCARRLSQFWRKLRKSIITESHKTPVEGRVPECRKQQAVVYVQPLGVARAILPSNDVAGAQQRQICDPGQGAAALPVGHQPVAEDILTDALDDQPLCLGALGQTGDGCPILFEWAVGQRHAQLIDTGHHGIKRGQV